MNVLFVCKYNRFRSKAAESFFNDVSEGSENRARSAGIIRGNAISESIRVAAKKAGITIRDSPRPLDIPLLRWQDIVVIVADDVPASIFCESRKQGKKVIVWSLSDCPEHDNDGQEHLLNEIKKRVKRLARSLQ